VLIGLISIRSLNHAKGMKSMALEPVLSQGALQADCRRRHASLSAIRVWKCPNLLFSPGGLHWSEAHNHGEDYPFGQLYLGNLSTRTIARIFRPQGSSA
jgi:hypothetical protein